MKKTMKKITNKKLKILNELRIDSKQKLLDISRKLKIPVSTVFNNYYELKEFLNMTHSIVFDFDTIGYPIRKIFCLKTNEFLKNSSLLKNNFHTNNLWRLENNNLLIDCLFKNLNDLEDFKMFLKQKNININMSNDLLKILKYEDFKPSIEKNI